MSQQQKIIIICPGDLKPEAFANLGHEVRPLENSQLLWNQGWLNELRGRDVIVTYHDEHYALTACVAAKRIIGVASEVRLARLSGKPESLPDELESAKPVPATLDNIDDNDFAALLNPEEDIPLHPAQDFKRGIQYYGVVLNREPYLVTSERELISFIECPRRNIILHNHEIPERRFSQEALIATIMGLHSVSPKEIFKSLVAYISEFVYLRDSEMYDMLAAWVIGTYIFRCFRYFPYLHINAEKGSGKTLLMEALAPICFNGELLTNPTGSSLLGIIGRKLPTLFIDETEALNTEQAGTKTELMAILNTGYSSNGRVVHSKNDFPTFCPKAFAGIQNINEVLVDRAITVRMSRKTDADKIQPYVMTEALLRRQQAIRDSLYAFGIEHAPTIAAAYVAANVRRKDITHLGNRSYDIWLPLVTIADYCGATASVVGVSRNDAATRRERANELDDTALLIQGLYEIPKQLNPIKHEGKMAWYNPDFVHEILTRGDYLPKRMSKKSLSRYLRQKLDIKSEPARIGMGLVRLYVIDWDKIDDYARRYFGNSSSWKTV
jgi:hypothetical protein